MRTKEECIRWDELSQKGWLNLTREELSELEQIAKHMEIDQERDEEFHPEQEVDEIQEYLNR